MRHKLTYLQTNHGVVEREDLQNVAEPNLAWAILAISSQRASTDNARVGACRQLRAIRASLPDEMVIFESCSGFFVMTIFLSTRLSS